MAKQLTVKELIEQLSTCKPDDLVRVEGCDCDGEAIEVEEGKGENAGTVWIMRNP